MKTQHRNAAPDRKRRLWLATALVGGALVVGGALWVAGPKTLAQGLPDLLGKAQPSVPKGALQVQDLQADPKGYRGNIVVRGVVAVSSPNDPKLIGLIDSREARVCQDLSCAKFYLPTRVAQSDLKPWDEVNVYGTMTEDASRNLVYLAASKVENLGSIKK
ncbi:hypothetical protein GJQ57_05130 [Ralstonia pickettii]|jgi:hypothetical protein|uniref:Uncharacterized protein n=1 Tax=Ralstonia pickettii TaxID=329 RepID=A0A7X2HK61_RALPI|nr:hypothetical protein [Ralstonia pickettii]MRS98038.1 hypothetical protein [Ralstonia pickettii]